VVSGPDDDGFLRAVLKAEHYSGVRRVGFAQYALLLAPLDVPQAHAVIVRSRHCSRLTGHRLKVRSRREAQLRLRQVELRTYRRVVELQAANSLPEVR
jgi:hypothetical protein